MRPPEAETALAAGLSPEEAMAEAAEAAGFSLQEVWVVIHFQLRLVVTVLQVVIHLRPRGPGDFGDPFGGQEDLEILVVIHLEVQEDLEILVVIHLEARGPGDFWSWR